MKKIHRRILTGILLTVLAAIVLLLGASLYMLAYALKPEALETRSRDIPGSYTYLYKEYPELQPWVDSLRTAHALRDTLIRSERGESLHALYVRAARPTARTAVIVHGYTDNAVRMLPIGYLYSRQLGYNILLPDLHAHGESEGEAVQMGWLDRLDVQQWIDTANELFGDSTRMVVHGISMGAATTMMVSGERLPAYVKCFVEDCGYTSVWDEFSGELKNQFGLPTFPLLDVTSWLCGLKYGWTFREASALEQVNAPCPCSSSTAIKMTSCPPGWCIRCMKPSPRRRNFGWCPARRMQCPIRETRWNIRAGCGILRTNISDNSRKSRILAAET